MWNVRVSALIENENKLLMVNHKKGKRSYWLLPGGKLELGESCILALKRELHEELSVNIDVGGIAFVVESIHKSEHFLQITFHCELSEPLRIRLGNDNRVVGFRFISIPELNNIIVYPDIKNELLFFLKYGKLQKRYFYKKWIP